jgi:chromate transporter
VAALFLGLKCAVLAIVAQAVARIGARALGGGAMRGIAAASFVLIFFLQAPFPLIVLGAGLVGWLGGRAGHPAFRAGGGHGGAGGAGGVADADTLLGEEPPAHARPSARDTAWSAAMWLALWLLPVAGLVLWLGPDHVFSRIATFFSTAAVVTFGGAYAVLGYVAQEAVGTYGWLTPAEMLDGLGLAETTPGPLVMVLQFVGFLGAYRDAGDMHPLLAATIGGLIATWVTFMPCFLSIFLGAPFIERLRGHRALAGALRAITAAVAGVVLNLAIWFAVHALFARVVAVEAGPVRFDAPVPASVDPLALLLTIGAGVAIFGLRWGVLRTLGASAGAALAAHLLG